MKDEYDLTMAVRGPALQRIQELREYGRKPLEEISHEVSHPEILGVGWCDAESAGGEAFMVDPLPWVNEQSGYWTFTGKSVKLELNVRPPYCDRGRFMVSVSPLDGCRDIVDAADRFPRYYFYLPAMNAELRAWLDVRNQMPEKADDE